MESLEDIIKGRIGMYAFFSRVLIDVPPKELLRDIFNGVIDFPNLKGVKLIKEFPKKFKSFEDFETAVRQEYTEVFIGPFENFVPLCQSEYEGELPYGKITIRVIEMLKRFGYEYLHREPADHIGVFMAFMAESCKELLRGNWEELKKQKEVIKELEKWVFDFCKRVEEHHAANFYKGIAMMLKDFLRIDKKLIEDLMLLHGRRYA